MPFVSTGHIWLLLILLVVVLIIWGPGKLPDVGSGLGRAIREFRKASNDTREEFAKAARGDEHSTPAAASQSSLPPSDRPAAEVPVTPVPGAAPLGAGSAVGSAADSERI